MKLMKLSTKARRSFARATGIPTTRSGRSRKVSRATGGCATLLLAALLILASLASLIGVALAEEKDFSTMTDKELTDLIYSAKNELYARELVNREGDLYVIDGFDDVSIRLTDIEFNVNNHISLNYLIVNNSDSPFTLYLEKCIVNGWQVTTIGSARVDPGLKEKGHLYLYAYDSGVEEDEPVEDISLKFNLYNDSQEMMIDDICLHFDKQ